MSSRHRSGCNYPRNPPPSTWEADILVPLSPIPVGLSNAKQPIQGVRMDRQKIYPFSIYYGTLRQSRRYIQEEYRRFIPCLGA